MAISFELFFLFFDTPAMNKTMKIIILNTMTREYCLKIQHDAKIKGEQKKKRIKDNTKITKLNGIINKNLGLRTP